MQAFQIVTKGAWESVLAAQPTTAVRGRDLATVVASAAVRGEWCGVSFDWTRNQFPLIACYFDDEREPVILGPRTVIRRKFRQLAVGPAVPAIMWGTALVGQQSAADRYIARQFLSLRLWSVEPPSENHDFQNNHILIAQRKVSHTVPTARGFYLAAHVPLVKRLRVVVRHSAANAGDVSFVTVPLYAEVDDDEVWPTTATYPPTDIRSGTAQLLTSPLAANSVTSLVWSGSDPADPAAMVAHNVGIACDTVSGAGVHTFYISLYVELAVS
jgi:hypothetical protein